MTEIDLTYIVAPSIIAVTGVIYSYLRLQKEERKVKASEAGAKASVASFQAMTVYHSKRLEIEEEKLEIARGNGGVNTVHVKEHSREARKTQEPEAETTIQKYIPEAETTIQKYIRVRDHVKPPEPMMSDEEFAARVKRIREMGQ